MFKSVDKMFFNFIHVSNIVSFQKKNLIQFFFSSSLIPKNRMLYISVTWTSNCTHTYVRYFYFFFSFFKVNFRSSIYKKEERIRKKSPIIRKLISSHVFKNNLEYDLEVTLKSYLYLK